MVHDAEQIQDQLGGLLAIADEQQKAVDAALVGLRAESERLARARAALEALPDKLVGATKAGAVEAVQSTATGAEQSLERLRASAEQTDAALARSVASFRKAWGATLIGFTGCVCLVVVAFAVGFGAWERHELEQLTRQKETLEANVTALQAAETDLERRGRRLVWQTCGDDLCFEVNQRDPGTWRSAGGVRLAIPATIRDR